MLTLLEARKCFIAMIDMRCVACAQLRLNKVSELIHNSEHHRNLESAQVSVYFQEIVDQVRGPCQALRCMAISCTLTEPYLHMHQRLLGQAWRPHVSGGRTRRWQDWHWHKRRSFRASNKHIWHSGRSGASHDNTDSSTLCERKEGAF